MSTLIATPRAVLPLVLVALSAALAPKAFAGFELIDSPAAPVSRATAPPQGQDAAQMQQTINALRVEIQSLRVRLAAAEADANGSRQELLAISAQQEQIQGLINHMTLNFAFGHSRFGPSAADAEVLVRSAHTARQVKIFGYTDSVGTMEANRRVAQLRAEAAKLYLVQRGVEASKISAQGQVGNYIASNDTATGRAVNRRVEFEFSATANEARSSYEVSERPVQVSGLQAHVIQE
ncbi:outer membrane protein OmpA-like peptidoglycan-associated protein [Pseudomonas hunanensis]|uniref:Outer membrane protein OmpA-like peptidoglycan-associated protein n=1 Tax=Pseudomonas hunanensis TaxID=1247546 RepID=A0ACC6K157_9PSED|nr:OmpA family protein [Pseudomonas hunanensis]MDR6712136.1 outer membrane protein OmpA-like peptidoglycan-associated protein [Pseudomonas hunanensis]